MDENKIKEYIQNIIETDDIELDELLNNAEYLEELQENDFATDLTMEQFNSIVNTIKDTTEQEIIIDKKELSKQPIVTSKKEITIKNAYVSQPVPISNTNLITNDNFQLNIVPFDEKKFQLLLDNAEKMIIPSHIKYLKFGRFLSSEFYSDVACTCLNLQVKFDYTYDQIPITNELKITAYCSIYDSSRNVCISGISASEFLIKTERNEEGIMDEMIRDDHQVIEIAQTRSFRRAMRYVIPTIIQEKILDMIEQRYYPQNFKGSKKSSSETITDETTNTELVSKRKKATSKANALKQIR